MPKNIHMHINTQTITIVDTTAPVLVTPDFNESIDADCDAIPEIPELQFEDNCSTDVTVTFNEAINFFPNTDDYEINTKYIVYSLLQCKVAT